MKIVEIFDSIDGEGLRTGQLVSFVRTAGCNLRCSYCDTLYALFGEAEPCKYREMSVDEILAGVNPKFKRVTLTGGEPLLAQGAAELIDALLDNGFEVNVETNGAADISKIKRRDGLFFTIDYKLPSSGMNDKMYMNNFFSLLPCDVIKFVIGSDEDFKKTVEITEMLKVKYEEMPHIYLGAVYGSYDNAKLAEMMLKTDVLKDAALQIQLHKVIWDPDKRGV